MTTEELVRMAKEAGFEVFKFLGHPRTRKESVFDSGDQDIFDELTSFAALVAAAERERICAAIKAEDDHCADGDYMLDSDDCISVARGTWIRPDWG